MDDSSHTHADLTIGIYPLFKSILSSVCLICHHHDIPSRRERLVRFLELLHGGEDDSIRLTSQE